MKYALLIYATPGAAGTAEPQQGDGVIGSWLDYTRAIRESGALIAAEQLDQTDTATSVRLGGGERLLTDGPFMETKEHLLGFFLIDVPDLDAALDWAARMPNTAHGTTEVRAAVSGRPWQALLDS